MATLFDDASLVMIPSGYKDDKLYSIKPTSGAGDFTFSRDGSGASPATRVNSAGLIEKGRTNLLLQSNSFDTTWANASSTETSGQSGYDGTNDAWLLNKTGSSGRIQQTTSTSGVQTYSVYLKSGSYDWALLLLTTSGGDKSGYFDLDNGVVGTGFGLIDSNIESLGNGWYRCSITFNATTTSARVYPALGNTNLGTSGSIYIQDAQLEKGLVATSYIETTTAAASAGILGDMPRLDYSGGASCPSLLLEPARTNADPNAEYLANRPIVTNVSVTTNSTTSPEGVVNASTITNNTTNGQHQLTDNTFSVTSGTDYTISLFLKYNDAQYVRLQFGGTPFGSTNWQNFDVQNGTKGSNGGGITSADASIEDYGNGWYRCIVTADATATGSNGAFQIRVLEDDNTSDVPSFTGTGLSTYAYGAQFEAGSYPTSYIPSYGSATARAKDSSEATGLGGSLGSTEGTIFLEVSALTNDLSERRFALSNGTTGNVARVGFTNVSNRILAVLYNGANQCVLAYEGADITQTNKIAFTYAANDFALYVNGESRRTDTSGSTFTAGTLTEVHFNEGDGNGNESFGNFKQVVIFPTRLTNAELASLTTI